MLPKFISDIVPSKRGGCRIWFEVEKSSLIWLCVVANGVFIQIPFSQDGMTELETELNTVMCEIDDLEHQEDYAAQVAAAAAPAATPTDIDDIPF